MKTPVTPPKKKKSTKKKPLSIRERKFIKAVMAGECPTTAMKTAGYSEYTANWGAGKKLREPKIQETIQELMDKKGLSDDKLLDVLDRGLEATKVIACNVIAPNGEGMKDANSMTKDFVDVEDYAVRHKYMETGLKLRGHLKNDANINFDGAPLIIFTERSKKKGEKKDGRTQTGSDKKKS